MLNLANIYEFDISSSNGEIKIPYEYIDEEPSEYNWISNKSIRFYDNKNNHDFNIDISNFITNNPKLQKKEYGVYKQTEKGILSFKGYIYCGKVQDIIQNGVINCTLQISSLSFR
jgi:hypothetical protein